MNFVQMGLNGQVRAVANLFGRWLDGQGNPAGAVTPEMLEEAAAANEPLLIAMLHRFTPSDLMPVRLVPVAIVQAFRTRQETGHPYMWVLRELSRHHPAHAQAIDRYPAWYRQQMDAACDYLWPGTAPQPPPTGPG